MNSHENAFAGGRLVAGAERRGVHRVLQREARGRRARPRDVLVGFPTPQTVQNVHSRVVREGDRSVRRPSCSGFYQQIHPVLHVRGHL